MNIRGVRLLLLGAALGLAGCGPAEPEAVENVENVEPPEPEPEPQPQPEMIVRSRPYMGTVFRISAYGPPAEAEEAIAAAFREIDRLEHVLSEWREDSEISRINQQAGVAPVRVSDDVFAVVEAGLNVSRWSDGAFDLSWAALRGLYDFRPGQRRIPTRSDVRPQLRLIDWRKIQIDAAARTVFLEEEGMAIGTGSIGKGYALDRAGGILRDHGIESYMLFGGGQVQVHGPRPDPGDGRTAWRVGIQHPRRQDYFAFFDVADGGSVSTSGDYEHFFIDARGKRWHHILDPRTGLPVERTVSVTLTSDQGLYADALSTAAFVMGPQRAIRMLEGLEEVEARVVMLDNRCRIHGTPGAVDALTLRVELARGTLPGC